MEAPGGATAPPAEASDPQRVARMLKALASPVRIELLRLLTAPRTLAEIRLRPGRRDQGRAGRAMSSVTVRQHLGHLLEIGAIQVVPLTRDGRRRNHFLVHHRQLFALTEELRQLARIRPDVDLLLDGTQPGPAPPPPQPGARLTLVNGAREGQVFPLRAPRQGWLVGRRPDAEILLDYDPYVSLENTRVLRTADGFEVVDLPGSRNGTTLNWAPLPKGRPQALATGDVVGVGRSTLVFRSA
jgi:DNA-binding transcriptional ArsR family regulator